MILGGRRSGRGGTSGARWRRGRVYGRAWARTFHSHRHARLSRALVGDFRRLTWRTTKNIGRRRVDTDSHDAKHAATRRDGKAGRELERSRDQRSSRERHRAVHRPSLSLEAVPVHGGHPGAAARRRDRHRHLHAGLGGRSDAARRGEPADRARRRAVGHGRSRALCSSTSATTCAPRAFSWRALAHAAKIRAATSSPRACRRQVSRSTAIAVVATRNLADRSADDQRRRTAYSLIERAGPVRLLP